MDTDMAHIYRVLTDDGSETQRKALKSWSNTMFRHLTMTENLVVKCLLS
ncbi:hypothetical protein GDO78_001689 [Eleutherodactylus coqui]|uniref:Uncharacterized protein n=1 Tax=Eleutherodactylus coqui TaxID=57060 RepID=A0A8J6KNY1_ELECQ|nr:hypothetical protein GDO78_001689 [Eleutherodactylus coqui]